MQLRMRDLCAWCWPGDAVVRGSRVDAVGVTASGPSHAALAACCVGDWVRVTGPVESARWGGRDVRVIGARSVYRAGPIRAEVPDHAREHPHQTAGTAVSGARRNTPVCWLCLGWDRMEGFSGKFGPKSGAGAARFVAGAAIPC